jgi:DNA polymerase-3 subunit chi
MTQVLFYQLQRSALADVLPKLLERTLAEGQRAVVMAGSEERVEAIVGELWTYRPDSWLPHGSAVDGHADDQPIWVTCREENPNGATFLFLTDSADVADLAAFARCFDLFDGNDAAALAAARLRWRARREAGHEVTFWQQGEKGGWERKG